MTPNSRLPLALLLLRLSVFLVMLVWTLDKFINPQHAAAVYEKFYFLAGLGKAVMFTVGGLELALLVAFLLGVRKGFSYAAVLVLHGISTLSSYQQYLSPYEGANILFFAAWPMLAACAALYLLREQDVLWILPTR